MRANRRSLLIALGALFLAQGTLQTLAIFPLWKKNYAPKGQVAAGLSPDQMLLAVAGLREMVASILWVRADSFFDQGNYDAILPIIRMVTWLDPSQIDVYATGMWHIGYNFTDEQSRSDRRYIPSALALGAEGARNNPNTYELFFETGWMWYHKVNDDYDKAVSWFEKAASHKDMIPARRNILSAAYLRNFEVEKALKHYYEQYDKANEVFKNVGGFGERAQRDTVENNLDNLLVRMSQRGYFAAKNNLPNPGLKYDTQPPFDVGFSAQVTIPEPAQIRIKATWNVRPVGTRIKVIFRDADYPNAKAAGLIWDATDEVSLDPPKNRTYLQEDNLFIKNRRADKTIDMSRDPVMYPLVADKYYLEFYYNPRSAPPHIQDKFGFNGEGMTADKMFLNTEIRPNQRVIFYRMEISLDQIKREGEWMDKTPVLQTPNYSEPSFRSGDDAVIQIPGILDEGKGK